VIQPHQILRGHNPPSLRKVAKQADEALANASMERANGHHINDLPVEEFDAGIGLEQVGFGHPVVFLHGKAMWHQHGHASSLERNGVIRKSSVAGWLVKISSIPSQR